MREKREFYWREKMPKPLQRRGNYEDYAHLRMLRVTSRKARRAIWKMMAWLECEHPSWPGRYERERVRI